MQRNVPVIWEPMRWSSNWIDLFRYPVNSRDGLPASARAEAILAVMKQLKKYRKSPSLWVAVDGPGTWYISELGHALFGCYQSIAVSTPDTKVSMSSFFRLPGAYSAKPSAPSFLASVFDEFSLPQKERTKLQVLRTLARMSIAGTKEIASASGYSHTYMRKLLPELAQERYVLYHESGIKEKKFKTPVWQIKRTGIQYAQRSWNIPDNVRFKGIRVEQKYGGQKHRKISRLWWAWLKKAYGSDYEIWQTWSEPSLGDAHPDALAWGSYQGLETLAWLEVESGKKSRMQTIRDIMYRYDRACIIAEAYDLQAIFVVLAQPWVLRSLQKGIRFSIPSNMAIVFENWRNAGYLCKPVFGDSSPLMGDKDYPYIQHTAKMLKKRPDFLLSKVSSKVVDEPPNKDLDLD